MISYFASYKALKLACVNSIGDNAYDSVYVAENLIKLLDSQYPNKIREYFDFPQNEKEINLEKIALKRNWILKGEKADITRTANVILSCFREGKMGKFTLDKPEDYGSI